MKFLRWIVTIAYAGFIFYLSSRPWRGLPSFPFSDKLFHLVLYSILGALILWSFRTTRLKGTAYIGYAALLAAALYGLSDEIHQLYVPGREFSLFDLIADAAGAAIGVMIATTFTTATGKQKVLI